MWGDAPPPRVEHRAALYGTRSRLTRSSSLWYLPDGLTADEAALRLDCHGPNELQTLQRTSAWHTLAAQFKNVLIVILLAATLLSGLLGHSLRHWLSRLSCFLPSCWGSCRIDRAERALEALRQMAALATDGLPAACPGG